MKHKKLFALVLAATLLLTACGGPAQAETEPPMVEYSHPVGITITLPQGFAQIETEGILAGFSNSAEAINVVFEEMLRRPSPWRTTPGSPPTVWASRSSPRPMPTAMCTCAMSRTAATMP